MTLTSKEIHLREEMKHLNKMPPGPERARVSRELMAIKPVTTRKPFPWRWVIYWLLIVVVPLLIIKGSQWVNQNWVGR
jgi:hypothetical protein